MECEIRGATDIAELQTMLDEWLVTVADRRVFEDRHVGPMTTAELYQHEKAYLSMSPGLRGLFDCAATQVRVDGKGCLPIHGETVQLPLAMANRTVIVSVSSELRSCTRNELR